MQSPGLSFQRLLGPRIQKLSFTGQSELDLLAPTVIGSGRLICSCSWSYAETPKVVECSGYERFTMYGRGTEQELDELESSLASGKRRIRALFCEIPSNPLLATPDLRRIRALADKYDFVVACDETLGTFINVDLLPYADVIMTSLTKIFSGASNVMGAR